MGTTPNTPVSDRRQATVVFADISGFTALSGKLDPEDLTDTMNACFKVFERIILEHGGTVDKIIGDCVMALFGAPLALEQASNRALNAAIEIRNSMADINKSRHLPVALDIHIGVNTGLVVAGDVGGDTRRDYTVMGPTVNHAQRLQSAASDGQIFVGATTHRATARAFEFRDLGGLNLKGVDEPVPAFELLSTTPQRYKTRPSTEAQQLVSPLVGREQELAAIRKSIADVVHGEGSIVSVIGENGLGKSRLMAEAQELEELQSVRLLEGRSLSLGDALSFHPFIDLFHSWAGIDRNAGDTDKVVGLEQAIGGLPLDEPDDVLCVVCMIMGIPLGGERAALFEGLESEALSKTIHRNVRDLIAAIAAEKPLVLLMEDLHWADQSSLGLLGALFPLVETHPILVINVCRPGYKDTSEITLALVGEKYPLRHKPIRLRPLNASDCTALVHNLTSSTDLPHSTLRLIIERTEGNPFYVEEVLRSLVEQGALERGTKGLRVTELLQSVEIPATIQEVIMTRVDRLEEPIRAILQMASVVGRRFYYDVLSAIAPSEVDLEGGLRFLIDNQFVLETTSRRTSNPRRVRLKADREYLFKHALIQETVYESLLKKTRRELHAHCATAIESIFADRLEDSYGMLAYHYARADDLVKAEDYMLKAGEEAAKSAASAEALKYFQDAYRIYNQIHKENADPEKKARLEHNIGLALFNIGNLTESIEHFDEALTFFGEWVPRSRRALWLKFAVDLPIVLAQLYLDWAGRNRGRELERDFQVMRILYNRARAESPTDPQRYFFDVIAATRYIHRLKPSSVPQGCGMYATAGAFFAFGGVSFGVARRFLAGARKLARENRPTDTFQERAMQSVIDFHSGDWDGERDMDDELFNTGLRAGLLFDADTYLGMVAERNIHQGKFDLSRQQIEQFEELRVKFGYDFSLSNQLAMIAFLALEERRLNDARDAVEEYRKARHEDTLNLLAASLAAKIDVLDGKLDAAAVSLDRAKALVGGGAQMSPFYEGSYRTARLALHVAIMEAATETERKKLVRSGAKILKRAAAVADNIARERVEVYELAAKFEELAGRHSEALRWCERAIIEAEVLEMIPGLARASLRASELLADGETISDLNASAWRERAVDAYREVGLEKELEKLGAPTSRATQAQTA